VTEKHPACGAGIRAICALHAVQLEIDWLDDVLRELAPSTIESDGFVDPGAFIKDCDEIGRD
jgi:hypothetical protein